MKRRLDHAKASGASYPRRTLQSAAICVTLLILEVAWPTADDICKFSKQRGSAFKRDSRVGP